MGNWKERIAKANLDWDYDNAEARALVRELLGEAVPLFAPAKVKEVPDDENIDLRGKFDGSPIRFAIWMSFGSFWAIEMRCPNRTGVIQIERDFDKMPKEHDEDDPWSDDEERRVFLGKGIFIEGHDRDIDSGLSTWGKLGEPLQQTLLASMEELDLTRIYSFSSDISLGANPKLADLDDPIDYFKRCAELLAELKNEIGQGDWDPSNPASYQAAPSSAMMKCRYCSSHYILAPGQKGCPNCGAPAE